MLSEKLTKLLLAGLSHRKGKGNAITSKKIVEALESKGITTNGAEIRENIAELRKQGHFICGDNSGYYLASNEMEGKAQIKSMRSRVFEMLKVVSALEESYNKNFSQSSTLFE